MQRAFTVIGRNPSTLLTELSKFRLPESSSKTLLFTLAPSSNVSPRELSALTTSLTKHFPVHVGCISAPIPLSGQRPAYCSVSLALVDGIPFRSTIPGLPETQVGRWHAGRNRNLSDSGARLSDSLHANVSPADMLDTALMSNGKINWEKVWSVPPSLSLQTGPGPLPEELRNLECVLIISVYFSDKASEGISIGLQNAFPNAHKVSCLLASSTPFLTGRPFTLFHNGRVHSSGAVGVAFPSSTPLLDLAFPPLVALTPPLPVTSSKGNLLLSIDSRNPTRLLLNHFFPNTAVAGKEGTFYVGVVENDNLAQVHRISSGDPSRGTIALDTNMAPREGSTVRLFQLPRKTHGVTISTISDSTPKLSLSMLVSAEVELSPSLPQESHLGDLELRCSTNGIVLSSGSHLRRTTRHGHATVPGCRVTLSWDPARN
ncbi:hypothetical protein EDD15DRAFT_2285654 [Pisolithus albus]|nr:hypothetical protein EDD15DRAFT_2285654 [Pisolithus albus]